MLIPGEIGADCGTEVLGLFDSHHHHPGEGLESRLQMLIIKALDPPILGPKFGPIPNAKKYVFFPDKKNPNSTPKKIFFFEGGFSICISYNTNTDD